MKWHDRLARDSQLLLDQCDIDMDSASLVQRVIELSFAAALLAGAFFYINSSPIAGYLAFLAALVCVPAVSNAWLLVRANKRAEEIEDMLPNFLSMMASNIRSGVTYDRALLLSTRKEFGPLSKEIDRAARQTVGGKPLSDALMEMALRSRSETFAKTMRLIVEGTKAGGNLAEMLENTAIDIRKAASLKKDISATILIYKLFIFIAAVFGAPLLYSLTTFLLEVFAGIRGRAAGISGPGTDLPFIMQGGTGISGETFFWFSIVAISMTAFFSSMAAGVISKGKESEGFRDVIWAIPLSLGIFFLVKIAFQSMLGQVFSV